ncbi:MAG: orotidine-5'-phosphate decarboxylase [Patescibacteria group bacterium]
MISFFDKLNEAMQQNNSLLCVGLDSDFDKIPECLKKGKDKSGGFSSRQRGEMVLKFNQAIIDATKDVVCAYKPNTAFYEALGGRGIEVLKQTIAYIRERAPLIPVILDAKRGDIGSTNAAYVQFAFSYLKADAITLNPYLGKEALIPFLDQQEKGIFVLCRTSNPGAGEFQDIKDAQSEPLYKKVARRVTAQWNTNGNCGLVVGATFSEELKEVRSLVGDMPILIPGIGTQGGDVEKTVKAGLNILHQGIIINSSRGIIFASPNEDFADAAKAEAIKIREEINKFRLL